MKLREDQVAELIGSVSVSELRLWVAEGWLAPETDTSDPGDPGFDELDIARVRLVCQLREDCALPQEAIPVVLSLIDQIHGLRRELKGLATAVAAEPEDVRARIRSSYHAGRNQS